MTVPSSLWTVGCGAKGGVAVGSFAVFGHNNESKIQRRRIQEKSP